MTKTVESVGTDPRILSSGNDREEISAHRNILVARSDVFKRILLSEMKEATQGVIAFSEFPSDILHVILEYLYTE